MRGVALTLDTDWAPDPAIDFAAAILIRRRAKATWFITHASPAIARLARYPDLFELGIHPNFMVGSTHGDTPARVLAHCMRLVPDARAMRTHALLQSAPLLDLVMHRSPIESDYSLLLPDARHLTPVEYPRGGKVLLRVPFHWEDDLEMERSPPSWAVRARGIGLRVFNFHPIHVLLNSASMLRYEQLKARTRSLKKATLADIGPLMNEGEGARFAFERVASAAGRLGGGFCARDILAHWKESRKQGKLGRT